METDFSDLTEAEVTQRATDLLDVTERLERLHVKTRRTVLIGSYPAAYGKLKAVYESLNRLFTET